MKMIRVPGTTIIIEKLFILYRVVPWYLGTFVYNNSVLQYHEKKKIVSRGTVWGHQPS